MSKEFDVRKLIKLYKTKLSDRITFIEENGNSILDLLSLGDEYDNPDAILIALDLLTDAFSHISILFHEENLKFEILDTNYKIWKSKKDIYIKDILYKSNVKKGMTSSNAKPTAADINNYFFDKIASGEKHVKRMKRINKIRDNLSYLRVIRDSISMKLDTLRTMAKLLEKCIDSNLITPTIKGKKFKRSIYMDN